MVWDHPPTSLILSSGLTTVWLIIFRWSSPVELCRLRSGWSIQWYFSYLNSDVSDMSIVSIYLWESRISLSALFVVNYSSILIVVEMLTLKCCCYCTLGLSRSNNCFMNFHGLLLLVWKCLKHFSCLQRTGAVWGWSVWAAPPFARPPFCPVQEYSVILWYSVFLFFVLQPFCQFVIWMEASTIDVSRMW